MLFLAPIRLYALLILISFIIVGALSFLVIKDESKKGFSTGDTVLLDQAQNPEDVIHHKSVNNMICLGTVKEYFGLGYYSLKYISCYFTVEGHEKTIRSTLVADAAPYIREDHLHLVYFKDSINGPLFTGETAYYPVHTKMCYREREDLKHPGCMFEESESLNWYLFNEKTGFEKIRYPIRSITEFEQGMLQ